MNFCEQNAKLFNVMAGGRCSNHCALKGKGAQLSLLN